MEFNKSELHLALAVSLIVASFYVCAANDSIEEVTIVGKPAQGDQVAGSAHYINLQEIEKLGHSDIQRIIRQIPGVSVQIEDGYGLRPNISIRGVTTERSSRITLLEDNILIAPAPYSAPSAYYFPTSGRMVGVEVLKGPAAITQGPYTIGGALNMLSTPIPTESAGKLLLEAGEDATYRLHAIYGNQYDSGFGFLLETHQWQSDGFQSIDRGGDSGLDLNDYTVKLGYRSQGGDHYFELKYQVANQDSNQSYLGLTDGDFSANGFRRYGLSVLDNIHTEHDQIIVRWNLDIKQNFTATTVYYHNKHLRDWFKTEGIDTDGSSDAQDFSRTSWFNVIQAINHGDNLNGLTTKQLQGILDGTLNTARGAIQIRSNAREYYSRGFQFSLDWNFTTGILNHTLNLGLRIHEDQEDRLQRNSTYSQINGQLVLADLGLLGNAGNRIQAARATSWYIYDRIEADSWVFTPGIRYEDINQARTRWETRANRTTNTASRTDANLRSRRQNDTQIWLPGIGIIYHLNATSSLYGGVHKGFTAPSNASGVREEEAINYELGFRYNTNQMNVELTYFHSNYDNLLGECTASSGSNCTIGDAFNGDAASINGIEAMLASELNPNGSLSIPLNLTYSYINGEFNTDIADTNFFGDVSTGDPIPYIPEHQFNLVVGLKQGYWGAYLAANFVGSTCVRASCNAFETTDDAFTIDIAGNYQITDDIQIFAHIENIANIEDIVGRHPYGARPNKARTASLGIKVNF